MEGKQGSADILPVLSHAHAHTHAARKAGRQGEREGGWQVGRLAGYRVEREAGR